MQKPSVIQTLGVVNIVLAGLGILGALAGVVTIPLTSRANPAMAEAYTGGVLIAAIAFPLVGLVTKGMMLFSGIGLVRGQVYGRSLGIAWAWASMVYGLIFAAVNGLYISPVVMKASFQNAQQQQGSTQAAAQVMQVIESVTMVMTLVMGLAMALVYQITFLVLMNRPKVKAYFAVGPDARLEASDDAA